MKKFPLLSLSAFALIAFAAVTFMTPSSAHAATQAPSGFSIQVTPSPLVTTVKPGVPSDVTVQIRNNGSNPEDLKLQVRTFKFDDATGNISISDTESTELSQWVHFASPRFTVNPGQVFSEKITYAFPANSGFSYSFAIIITRQSEPHATGGGHLLLGSVADFGLVNVDRPGATRDLVVDSVKPSQGFYEYLPAKITLRLQNKGNTIVKPLGNVFIQRANSSKTLATLNVNEAEGYILPGTTRSVTTTWNDGFPRFDTTTLSDGTVKTKEVWDFKDLSKLRIGQYTAKVVAVYNNGTYDVPLNAETSFWVIPWKILLGALVLLLIIALGIFTIVRSIIRGVRRSKNSFSIRK